MLNKILEAEIYKLGADIVGFGNLSELPKEVRLGLPIGISIAIKFDKDIIRGISKLPTQAYADQYTEINEKLDCIVTMIAEFLIKQGYQAIAQTRENVGSGESEDSTTLPHKTVATRAGIGWIGKCAMLVTEQYGSMIRISSVLTDAPLQTAKAINTPRCGDCCACKDACPGEAVSGLPWNPGLHRDDFFDALKCRKAAEERSVAGFGGDITICGKCIEICPWTRRVLQGLAE